MPEQVVKARIRGFICTNAHPTGCALNVRRQIEVARGDGEGLGNVLVIGSSTGYGLGSLLTAVWGWSARAVGVCLERPASGNKTASAGWYNVAEMHRIAREEGREVATLVGDAYSHEIKDRVVELLRSHAAPIDMVIYSLASPRRKDPSGRA